MAASDPIGDYWRSQQGTHPAGPRYNEHPPGMAGGLGCLSCAQNYAEVGKISNRLHNAKVRSAEFYHGSDETFKPGDVLRSSAELIKSGARTDMANYSYDYDEDEGSPYVHATSDPREAATWGKNVYRVKPMVGPKSIRGDENDWHIEGHAQVLHPLQFGGAE